MFRKYYIKLYFFYYIWYFKVSLYLVLKNPIDYRTQAIAAGNPVAVGIARRVLTELIRNGIASVEGVRRHRPIIPILVEISKSIHISVGK